MMGARRAVLLASVVVWATARTTAQEVTTPAPTPPTTPPPPASSSWPTPNGDLHRSGRTPYACPTALTAWRNQSINRWVNDDAVELNGLLIRASPDFYYERHSISAQHLDREAEEWRIQLERGWIVTTPVVNAATGVVYAAANWGPFNHVCQSRLFAMDARGHVVHVRAGPPFGGSAALTAPMLTGEGNVFVATVPCSETFTLAVPITLFLFAADLQTVILQHDLLTHVDSVPVGVAFSSTFPVAFVAVADRFVALNTLNNAAAWQYVAPAGERFLSHPTVANDETDVYVVSSPQKNGNGPTTTGHPTVHAVTLTTGDLRWKTSLPVAFERPTTPALAHDGTLFVNGGRMLFALNATDGRLLWNHTAPEKTSVKSPVVCDNGVVLWTGFGHNPQEAGGIIALNATSGAVLWEKHDANNHFYYSTPFVTANSTVLVWVGGRELHQRR